MGGWWWEEGEGEGRRGGGGEWVGCGVCGWLMVVCVGRSGGGVFGVRSARWLDSPPQSGVAHGFI